MGCKKTLDFASPTGAHLSAYWTMDEAGAANKVDSTAGVVWPLLAGTLATPGLFSNGVDINARIRGLRVVDNPSLFINQSLSKGVSFWFWVQVVAYGSWGVACSLGIFYGAGNNDLVLDVHSQDASNTILDLYHYNGVDIAEVNPSVAWSLGSWHMVAGVYDKVAKTITVYADAVQVGTIADPFSYPDLGIGSAWQLVTPNPVGTVPHYICDEVGLCLNGALTQAQITSLWNGGAGMTWPTITSVVPYP